MILSIKSEEEEEEDGKKDSTLPSSFYTKYFQLRHPSWDSSLMNTLLTDSFISTAKLT
jgi:hypothetical protein